MSVSESSHGAYWQMLCKRALYNQWLKFLRNTYKESVFSTTTATNITCNEWSIYVKQTDIQFFFKNKSLKNFSLWKWPLAVSSFDKNVTYCWLFSLKHMFNSLKKLKLVFADDIWNISKKQKEQICMAKLNQKPKLSTSKENMYMMLVKKFCDP